jgi:hypothetical protein
MTPGKSQAWKSHARFPHPQPNDGYEVKFAARSAGEERDGTTVEPGAFLNLLWVIAFQRLLN